MIGAVGGGLLGYMIGAASNTDSGPGIIVIETQYEVPGLVIGAIVGIVIGGVVGAGVERTSWITLPLDADLSAQRLKMQLGRGADHPLALGFSYAF
jgi:hypothetical protein